MSQRRLIILVLVLAAAGFGFFLTGNDAPPAAQSAGKAIVVVELPSELSEAETIGAKVFEAKCSACHGANAAGNENAGPPLIHKIYEPSHHGDMAFFMAAERGVRAHHWRFGDMPRVEGITRAEVASVVAYIRAVQRNNGIS